MIYYAKIVQIFCSNKYFAKKSSPPLDKAPKILYLCKNKTNTKDIRNIYEGYTKHKPTSRLSRLSRKAKRSAKK